MKEIKGYNEIVFENIKHIDEDGNLLTFKAITVLIPILM